MVRIGPRRSLPDVIPALTDDGDGGQIALLGDFTLAPSPDIEMTFKAPKDVLEPKDGCYISWKTVQDTTKLELLGVDIDMNIPKLKKDVGGTATTQNPTMHIQASVADENRVDEAIEEATGLLMERRRGKTASDEEPFVIRSQKEMLDMMGSTAQTLSFVLTAVAALSLLVGGIGIMNIMLVSVTERIKEIGLRMAIGATPACILWQFILEAVVLSTVGGAIGVALGVGAAKVIGEVNHWPIVIEFSSAVYSFLFSSFVGMFFGFYPAYRASKLNPIDCLRYE